MFDLLAIVGLFDCTQVHALPVCKEYYSLFDGEVLVRAEVLVCKLKGE